MATFPFSNLMDGTKKLATRIYNATGELFTPTNPGSVSLTGSNMIIQDLTLDMSGITLAMFGNNVTAWGGTVGYLDISKYAKREVWVYNTTDKECKIIIAVAQSLVPDGLLWSDITVEATRKTLVNAEPIAAGASKKFFAVGETDVGQNDIWLGMICLADFSVVGAPTSGTVRVMALGRTVA